MLQAFTTYIREQQMIGPGEPILAAVSGGIDSMVMLHLLVQAGYRPEVAHCNFMLRGEESDADEEFVKSYAASLGLACHVNHFDTLENARLKGISTQMAARALRYAWFHELAGQEGFHAIAIAHNSDDRVETFFINLARGTGLKGLTGISPVSGKIVRPLLFAGRQAIESYAIAEDIPYREDSSNQETYYDRNKIRHSAIPVFQEINPVFMKTMQENMGRLKEIYQVFQNTVEKAREKIVHNSDGLVFLPIHDLKENGQPVHVFLFEFIKEYGFTRHQAASIARSLDAIPGKQWHGPSHYLVKDREYLVISPLQTAGKEVFYIEEGAKAIEMPIPMKLEAYAKTETFQPGKDKSVAQMDMGQLDFPLIMRKWKQGDYFKPLGMEGFKKVSDFFTDNKFSLVDKEKTWIMTSGEKICWIVGHRLDDRFKITPRTRQVLEIKLLEFFS
jgi:tRNA(Ile)-lysidine synthase